ncbi:uncharacterized protein DUF4340 [Anaerobacterium chartisolvens]|uniref:Uncharacterized protein DUF4340 n=1 Tax=Anaerobacterium chartisolvens TaxID=1297424 RepID=A0A369BHA5_9FIRM|nr:DUF4340 domain-containing protein [Anaerobacterium chartisolvens]RCX20933.1 uncharacterized protein DUF4340 [Anaerobacterium chartisolvens]
MKFYRNAIILIAVLALLVAAYFLVINKSDDKDSEQPGADIGTIRVSDYKAEDVKKIIIENRDEKLEFEKKDEKWGLSSPADLKVNPDSVTGMAMEVTGLIASKIVDEDASDVGKYGLDAPGLLITVILGDDTSRVIELGNQTPLGDGYYVREKDKTKVYVISKYVGEKLLNAKNNLRDKTIFPGNAEDIVSISMERGGTLVYSAKKQDASTWSLTAPIEGSVNVDSLGRMVEAVANVIVADFVEEKPSDLAKYGLESPAYSLEYESAKDGKIKLMLGTLNKDTYRFYAKLESSEEVFEIDSTAFDFLDKPLKEIVDVFVYIVNISDVSRIVVDMDGKTTTCDIETDKDNDNDKDKFTVDGKNATMKDENGNQPFRKFYQALIGITLNDIEIGPEPKGDAEITLTYYLRKAPNKMTVEFVSKDDNYYYVVKNGKYSNIIVRKDKFNETEGVKETYNKLMEALNK